MKTKFIAILCFLTNFVANAGDTAFITSPVTRSLNPQYLQQIFNDEFSGTSLNTTIWDVNQCKSRGYYGNNEGEPNNITVSNGTLKLTARYSPGNIDNNCWEGTHFVSDFTTAEIWSSKNRYKYGSFEARCLMPKGIHYYYAYWLWGPVGDGYPQDGFTSEIDISEGCEWGSDGTHHNMKSTFHLWPQPGDQIPLPDYTIWGYGNIYEGAWHIYKIIWNPYEVIFYIDSYEVARRTRYYTGSDMTANDVGMNQIIPGVTYHERSWFPNDEMGTVFQMHNTKFTPASDLPATMEVDYVRVKQFFLAPEITAPSVVCSTWTVTLDVDPLATNISWQLSPASLFTTSTGSGKTANIVIASAAVGIGQITYTFQMPSGETFNASKDIYVSKLVAPVVRNTKYSGEGEPMQIQFTANQFTEGAPNTYNWYVNNTLVESNYNDNIFIRYIPCGHTINVKCKISNVCMTSPYSSNHTLTNDCSRYLVLLITPNPSINEAIISIESASKESFDLSTPWELEVYDQMQIMKEKKTAIRGKQTKIDITNWKDGVYIVRAKIGEEIISGKLLVKP